MNHAEQLEIIREPFNRIFGVEPERPIDPPEPREASIDIAEKRLRTSLIALNKSEYFDELALHIFDEITDEEADRVIVALLEGESTVIYDIMCQVKERAIRVTAEQYIEALGRIA